MENNKPLPEKQFLIVVDAGHGGHDKGASWNGRLEKDDNLRIAKAVDEELKRQGLNPFMTRESDIFISLADRANLANELNADLFVSLHRNSYPEQTPTTMGIENFIYLTAPEETSQRAAQLVQDAVVGVGTQLDRGVSRGNYYVLRMTNMPSMLLEMGFIINDKDNEMFDQHLDEYAVAITKGIMQYFGLEYNENAGEESIAMIDENIPLPVEEEAVPVTLPQNDSWIPAIDTTDREFRRSLQNMNVRYYRDPPTMNVQNLDTQPESPQQEQPAQQQPQQNQQQNQNQQRPQQNQQQNQNQQQPQQNQQQNQNQQRPQQNQQQGQRQQQPQQNQQQNQNQQQPQQNQQQNQNQQQPQQNQQGQNQQLQQNQQGQNQQQIHNQHRSQQNRQQLQNQQRAQQNRQPVQPPVQEQIVEPEVAITEEIVAVPDSDRLTEIAQEQLNDIFGANLPADNSYNNKTRMAFLKALQLSMNASLGTKIPVHGIFDITTRENLPTLREGDEGNMVLLLQLLLMLRGYDPGKADSLYGSQTAEAVRQFQTDYNLNADGVAGPRTFTYLLA